MKRILSVSLVILCLLSLASAMTACGDQTATCYICHEEHHKSEMDSGRFEDEIIYVCDDCIVDIGDSSGVPGDEHAGHNHPH